MPAYDFSDSKAETDFNPYASPASTGSLTHETRVEYLRKRLQRRMAWPAIALLITSGLWLLAQLIMCVSQPKFLPVGLAYGLLQIPAIIAGMLLLATRSQIAGYLAAFVAIIPFLSPFICVGWVFGFWILAEVLGAQNAAKKYAHAMAPYRERE